MSAKAEFQTRCSNISHDKNPIATGGQAFLTQFVRHLRVGHDNFPSSLQFGDEVGYFCIRIRLLLLLEQGFDRARKRGDLTRPGCSALF